jgi:hypothetical protein
VVWGDATYFSEETLAVRMVALVLVVPPPVAELALLEHGAFLEVVGWTVAPPAWLGAGLASVKPRVAQLSTRDAYFCVAHAGDLVSTVDSGHDALVGIGLG